MSADPGVLGLWLWLIATVGHVWLTGHWVARLGASGRSRDERWFVTVLVAVGTLSIVLHGVAATVGLGLGAVLAALGAGHLTVAVLARRSRQPPDAPPAGPPPGPAVAWLERAAAIALAATVMAWLVAGTRTLEVRGTDAAHYHVPVAVNLALGESPLGLTTTQHLYPMASSTLAAWFLLPVGDALLIDLVMVLPFLLTAASLGWLFRLVTGQSGLAWCTWLTLAVFSTPMFRQASLMSADLLFAASFAALTAALLAVVVRRGLTRTDVLAIGLATGLLIGAKTTGLVAAVLLLGLGALAVLAGSWRDRARWPMGGLGAWSLAAVGVVGAGGLWLIRNWWLFGSPVAPTGLTVFGLEIFRGPPLEPTTYLSILGDLGGDEEYDLVSRASTYIGEWFGRWYLLALVPAFLVPADALVGWWRGRSTGTARLLLIAGVAGTGVPMLWLLVGAPWTSLEWTQGMALRYALPWFLLLPLVAWIGVFPAGFPWYTRTWPALVVGGLAAVASLALLTTGHPSRPFPPAVTWPAVLVAAGGWAWLRLGPRLWRHAVVASTAVALLGGAAWLVHRDGIARTEARAWRAGTDPTPTQRLYAAVLAAEGDLGRTCEARRFFALTRFDEPLGVQDLVFRNRVYYAAREVAATARVTEPMGPCDYIVSTRAMLDTAKAAELIRVLNPYGRTAELGAVGAFVLLGQR